MEGIVKKHLQWRAKELLRGDPSLEPIQIALGLDIALEDARKLRDEVRREKEIAKRKP